MGQIKNIKLHIVTDIKTWRIVRKMYLRSGARRGVRRRYGVGNGPGRRGADKRKAYDIIFQLQVLNQIELGKKKKTIALENSIHLSLVCKWEKRRDLIIRKFNDTIVKCLSGCQTDVRGQKQGKRRVQGPWYCNICNELEDAKKTEEDKNEENEDEETPVPLTLVSDSTSPGGKGGKSSKKKKK